MNNKENSILMVDDNPANLGVLGNILHEQGYDLHIAVDGKEALEVAKRISPDLILLDVVMSEIDGFEVCKMMKKDPVLYEIPVIFLTVKNETQMIERGFEVGGVDYVTKPFNSGELLARIRTHLSLRKALSRQKELSLQLITKNEELENDLIVAEKLQEKLFSTSIDIPFLDIAIKSLPHSFVSGDIYYVGHTGAHTANLFLGDGSGHGVAAALTTIMADMVLKQYCDESPADMMKHLNRIFEEQLPSDRFMSGIYLQISQTGKLTLSNSGHPPLVILPADESQPVFFSHTQPILGILLAEMPQPKQIEYQMKPGDVGVLFTDGIYERVNSQQSQFGLDRYLEFLSDTPFINLDSVISQSLEQLNSYAEGSPLDDDLTMLVFRYLGS